MPSHWYSTLLYYAITLLSYIVKSFNDNVILFCDIIQLQSSYVSDDMPSYSVILLCEVIPSYCYIYPVSDAMSSYCYPNLWCDVIIFSSYVSDILPSYSILSYISDAMLSYCYPTLWIHPIRQCYPSLWCHAIIVSSYVSDAMSSYCYPTLWCHAIILSS